LSLSPLTIAIHYTAAPAIRDDEFLRGIGLADLAQDGHARIGSEVMPPGQALGVGLTAAAAEQMGLLPGMCLPRCKSLPTLTPRVGARASSLPSFDT